VTAYCNLTTIPCAFLGTLQASSTAKDDKGATPVMGKFVKTLAVKKKWRNALQEQDRIVKFLVTSMKQTSMPMV
jgi:hypothetical protein